MSDNTPSGPPQDENDPYAAQPPADQAPPSDSDVPPAPAPGPDVPPAPAPGPPPASPYGQPAPGAPQYEQPQYGAPGQPPYNQPPPYGAPGQQPYPQQPYGSAPGQQVQIGEAFSYGWLKFQQNVGTILLGVLAYLVAIGVVVGIFYGILIGGASAASSSSLDNANALGALFGFSGLLIAAIVGLLAVFMQAGVIRASLEISHGRPVAFGTFFQFADFGKVLLAVLLVGVGTAVGTLLCYLPGLVFGFFAQFTLFYVIDKGLSPVDALKASFSLVNKNLGTVVVLYIGVMVAQWIGSALCGVGLLVAVPVSILATTYVYRRLNNEVVAA